MVSFPNAIKLGFQHYVAFKGRSTRAEYWWWLLFTFLFNLALVIADLEIQSGYIRLLGNVGLLIPTLAVQIRRLHDINMSGLWISFFAVGYPYLLLDEAIIVTSLPWVSLFDLPFGYGFPVTLAYLIYILFLVAISGKQVDTGANKYDPDPRPVPPHVLICAQCQIELNPDAKFCTVCGTQVSQAIHDEIKVNGNNRRITGSIQKL